MPRIFIGTKAYIDANFDEFYNVPGLKSVETRGGRALRALKITAPVKALDRLEEILQEDYDIDDEESGLIEITDSWDRVVEVTVEGEASFMDRVWGFAPGIKVLDDRYETTIDDDRHRLIKIKGDVFSVWDLQVWMENERDAAGPDEGGFIVTFKPPND